MSNAMKAADDLKSIAARFRGIIEIAGVLEKIGSLEQAEREAHSRKESADKAASEAKKKAEVAEQALARYEKEFSDARLLSQQIISNAKQDAIGIFEKANAKADEIEQKALQRRSVIENEIVDRIKQSDNLHNTIKEQTKVLESITLRISEARKSVESLFNK